MRIRRLSSVAFVMAVLTTSMMFLWMTVTTVQAFPVATSSSAKSTSHPTTGTHLPATRDATRRRSSKRKFKTFENMLDAFRDELVIVYFTKHTCGPCLLQQRELWAVRRRLPAAVLTIDAAKWPAIATRYQVGKLPCLFVVKQQQVLARLEGLTTGNDLLEHVAMHVGTEDHEFDSRSAGGTDND